MTFDDGPVWKKYTRSVYKILKEYKELPQLSITNETIEDLNNISHGVFSPLKGFMGEADVDSIIKNDRLANGLPWTIPITLDISKEIPMSRVLNTIVTVMKKGISLFRLVTSLFLGILFSCSIGG